MRDMRSINANWNDFYFTPAVPGVKSPVIGMVSTFHPVLTPRELSEERENLPNARSFILPEYFLSLPLP